MPQLQGTPHPHWNLKKLALQQGEQAGDQPAEQPAEQPSQVSPAQQPAGQQPEDLLKTLCGADQTKRSPTCIPMYTRSVQWTPCTKKEFCGISIGLSHTRRAIPLSKNPGFFFPQEGGLGKVGARTNDTHTQGGRSWHMPQLQGIPHPH